MYEKLDAWEAHPRIQGPQKKARKHRRVWSLVTPPHVPSLDPSLSHTVLPLIFWAFTELKRDKMKKLRVT